MSPNELILPIRLLFSFQFIPPTPAHTHRHTPCHSYSGSSFLFSCHSLLQDSAKEIRGFPQIFEDLAPPVTAQGPQAPSYSGSHCFWPSSQSPALSWLHSPGPKYQVWCSNVALFSLGPFVILWPLSSSLSKAFRKLPLESGCSCFLLTQTCILTHAHRNLCVASFISSFKPSLFFKWSLLTFN